MKIFLETILGLLGIAALTLAVPVQIALVYDFPPAMLFAALYAPLSMAVIFPTKYKG